MLWNMNNNLVSMNEKQNQLATGKKIQKPSDDPVGTTRIIKVKSDIVENEQYKDNARDAQSWLDVSENSLMDTKDILQRVRELAVQGANDTYTAGETDKIAKEIDQLIEEIIVNANSTMAGRYLFSGFQTDEPLLNEDGTYNININSEKVTDFDSIAYEVAVGEHLLVGTNYLDVYGIVAADHTIKDTFVFGNQGYDDPQVAEATGDAATRSKAQFPFNYKADLTTATTEIYFDGVTYTLDATKLIGNITQEEFTEILLGAEQTDPPPPAPPASTPILSGVAEAYFVASDDPSNTLGELVIEAKDFGPKIINVSDMTTLTFDVALPEITQGVAEVAPVNAKIEGYFDYGTSLIDKSLAFVFNGITYVVDVEEFDGSLTEEEFIEKIDNAADSTGRLLKDAVNVNFEATVGTRGFLTLESKVATDSPLILKDLTDGFTVFPKKTVGSNGDFSRASIKGIVDITQDLSAGALGDLSFKIDGLEYVVNTATMNGGLTKDQILTLIENAPNGSGGQLKDVANVSFTNATEPYLLTIEAIEPNNGTPEVVDNNAFFNSTPTLIDGVFIENRLYDESSFGTTSKLDGPINLAKDMTGAAVGDLSFTIGDKTYTVDTTTMDGTLTTDQFLSLIESASDGSGGTLGDVAFVTFSNNVDPYELSIESKVPGSLNVSGVDEYDFFLTGATLTDGAADVDGVKSKVTGALDLETNRTGDSLSFTIDGVTYDVAMGTMDGTLLPADVQTLIETASNAGPPVTQLSSIATVTVNSSVTPPVNPYEFTIESNVATDDKIIVNDTGGIYVESPYDIGSSNEDVVLTGNAKITDAMLSDPVHGIGRQSFVITYNDVTKRIDVDLTSANTMAEMKALIDAELNIAFGDDGGTPATNNVSFDVVSNGTYDVVQFSGKAKTDGSETFLKVDTIISTKPQMIQDLEDFSKALSNKDNEGITKFLGQVDEHLDNVLSVIADVGAKTNRLDFIENRIGDNNIALTEILSKVQDIDYAEVTIKFKSLESIYRASLSVGAKVIQPTLVDFIQ
jgi:flagellin-like hook-associated protein FlgL